MNQSKIESGIETFLNIGSGFIISFFVWTFVVMPLWGFESSPVDNLYIVGVFTVTSIIRSYLWRRFFNAGLHAIVQAWFSAYQFNKIFKFNKIRYHKYEIMGVGNWWTDYKCINCGKEINVDDDVIFNVNGQTGCTK